SLEICTPTLNNRQSISTTLSTASSINVIGFVVRPPSSFDLIVDPYFFSHSPLISMDSVDGKKPENLLLTKQFMNCTGRLRLINPNRLFIDTPSTYGFSGAPCFTPTNAGERDFIGILTGTTKLWNKCTLLQKSTGFHYYYDKLVRNEEKQQQEQLKGEL
ncbi:unnamed protein product, partial [Didymodactylos carnosus]